MKTQSHYITFENVPLFPKFLFVAIMKLSSFFTDSSLNWIHICPEFISSFFSLIHAILSRNRCIYQGRASEFTGDKSKVGLWICRNIKQVSNSPHTVSHFSPKYPGGFILQSTPALSGVYYSMCLFCWKRHKSLPAPMITTSREALTVSPDFSYIVSFYFPRAEPLWKT